MRAKKRGKSVSRHAKSQNRASAARRKKRRRAAGRLQERLRWLGIRAGAVAFVVLTGAGWWFHHSGRYDAFVKSTQAKYEREVYDLSESLGLQVAQVYLEGRERMPKEEAMLAIGVVAGDPILAINVNEVKERLEETRWVESAEVQRALPNALHVRIVERKPVALWQKKGELQLIDKNGAVIEGEDISSYSYLPVIVGENAPQHAYALIEMLSATPDLFAEVSSAIRVGDRRWNVRFYDGKEVMLPEEHPEKAWKQLASLNREQSLLKRDIKRVDLRYGERVYVQLTPAAARREKQAQAEKDI